MSNIISFPQTAAFFLPQVGRCLPGLTEVVIELAAMVQRGEIEEELLKIKLKQKCFVALAELRATEALIFDSHFPADGSDQVGFRSPDSRAPLRLYSGALGSGVHVANRAVTQPPDAAPVESSDQEPSTVSLVHFDITSTKVPAVTSPPASISQAEHHRFPKGRW